MSPATSRTTIIRTLTTATRTLDLEYKFNA